MCCLLAKVIRIIRDKKQKARSGLQHVQLLTCLSLIKLPSSCSCIYGHQYQQNQQLYTKQKTLWIPACWCCACWPYRFFHEIYTAVSARRTTTSMTCVPQPLFSIARGRFRSTYYVLALLDLYKNTRSAGLYVFSYCESGLYGQYIHYGMNAERIGRHSRRFTIDA